MRDVRALELARGGEEPPGTARRAPSAYVLGHAPRAPWLLRSVTAAAAAVAIGGAVAYGVARLHRERSVAERHISGRHEHRAAIAAPAISAQGPKERSGEAAARRLYQGAALLALSVLADSTLEHYRGDFQNRAMFIAPAVASLTLAAASRGGARPSEGGAARNAVLATAVMTGIIGTGFHVYNTWKREGGFNWLNLFYGAPLGAPSAISVAGLFGLAAGRVASGDAIQPPHEEPKLFGCSPARILAGLASLGIIGTSAEVWLLHFRGAFQNPFMYVPVTVPPLAAAALALTALRPSHTKASVARALLASTAGVGLAGVGFHAYGISRNMGGWRNWSQMILQGPPLPAPPSFTGMALAGLGALQLLREEQR
jgi:hypothetical protein